MNQEGRFGVLFVILTERILFRELMMKIKLLALTSVLFLASCDEIGKKAMDALPNPSPEQEQVAQITYDHLRHSEFDLLTENFEPELKEKFENNGKEFKKFAHALPKEEYKTKKIVAKNIQKSTEKPSTYTVSYEYAYPKNLVQYDVSFDKAGGSTKIRDINVQIFGE